MELFYFLCVKLFMKKKIQKFWEWKCKTFGHSFKPIAVMIFRIKTNSINNMSATLKCGACGEIFVHKNAVETLPEVDPNRISRGYEGTDEKD